MKDKKRTALRAFFDGLTSFVAFPDWEEDARKRFRERRGPPDISRYFGIVGERISNTYVRFGEEHGIETVDK